MAYKGKICCYRTGPIERDPEASFHAKNQVDKFLIECDFEIIGDTFEHLEKMKRPQSVYGIEMKKLRDQGLILGYSKKELLLVMSFRKARRSDFIISRPAPIASAGTVSETVISWIKGIPKLVIIGPHHEGLLDNDSTFMIRMLTDRYSLVFDTERDVINFIKKHIKIFRQGRNAIRELIINIKKTNPHINDRPKPLWNDRFEGKTVLIYGYPGCGKDTQSQMLQHLCGFKVFSGGLELRRLGIKFPILGKSLGEGNLSPEIIMNYLMTSSLIKLEEFEPIVFAGNPKKIREARELMKILKILKRQPTVIVIDFSKRLSRQRIKYRRNCNVCVASFCNKELAKNPICPRCGNNLEPRPENINEKSIRKIFGWYKTHVEKVIEYFENLGLVTHINGHRSKEEIFSDILKILKR